jgi:hypothetical protein
MRNPNLVVTLQTPTTGTWRKISFGEELAINIRIAIKVKLDVSTQIKYSRLFVSTGLDCTNLRCGFCLPNKNVSTGFPSAFPNTLCYSCGAISFTQVRTPISVVHTWNFGQNRSWMDTLPFPVLVYSRIVQYLAGQKSSLLDSRPAHIPICIPRNIEGR